MFINTYVKFIFVFNYIFLLIDDLSNEFELPPSNKDIKLHDEIQVKKELP